MSSLPSIRSNSWRENTRLVQASLVGVRRRKFCRATHAASLTTKVSATQTPEVLRVLYRPSSASAQRQFGPTTYDHRWSVPGAMLGSVVAGNSGWIPTSKLLFGVAVCRQGNTGVTSKLAAKKHRIQDRKTTTPTVGDFFGREGSFFFKRGNNEKAVFSFDGTAVTTTQARIMGRKP